MYYFVFPEVAGGLGPKSIIENSTFPPKVITLDYQFDGWLGDDLLETFPCFIVTERLRDGLSKSKLKGFLFSNMIISKSSTFESLYPKKDLPPFYWLQVNGKILIDDFSVTDSGELIVSAQSKDLISNYEIDQAVFELYK
jgi:hypothetical protein